MAKLRVQWKDVLEYLETHEGISSMKAWEVFHITRLAAVVFRLRKMGYNVVSYDKTGKNDYGTYTYTEYKLED